MLSNVGGAGLAINPQSYDVTVGNGGAGGFGIGNDISPGSPGENSVFDNIVAEGGGRGAQNNQVGGDGGSGGGAGRQTTATARSGGSGELGQGNAGGNVPGNSNDNAGGGGGAGEPGGNATVDAGGDGGDGLANDITGVSLHYAGGGGGAGNSASAAGTGGLGGGGDGRGVTTGTAGSGAPNTGGGGGGIRAAAATTAGDGGSGIVVVRYQGSQAATGGTVTAGTGSATGYTIHSFTETGSSALDFSSLDLNERLGVTLTGDLSGDGGLQFDGPGRLELAGQNTYSGDTTVSGGTLLVTGSIASNANVGAGARLGGSGTVGGGLEVASGGSLLGNGGLTVNGALDLTGVGAGALIFTLGDPLTFSGVDAQGGIVIDELGFDQFDFTAVAGFAPGTYTLFDGLVTGSLNSANLTGTINGLPAFLHEGSLQLTVIPEPSVAVLGMLAALAGLGFGRRLRARPARHDSSLS